MGNLKKIQYSLIIFSIINILGCNSLPSSGEQNTTNTSNPTYEKNDISYGRIKKEIKIGESIQSDVMKLFGSPNNMVLNNRSRGEMWVYDRVFTESNTDLQSSSAGAAIGTSGAIIGARATQSSARSNSSVRVLTVIIEFDSSGTVTEISARQGGY